MARGMVKADAQTGTQLLLLATTRRFFTRYNAAGKVIDTDSSAYPMDLIDGPQQTF